MPKILTVDDSEVIRTIVTKQLSEKGFEVVEADGGEKALGILESGGFDLVLLDVSMPEMDGPTMLKNMRERGDKTPVLLVTSESKKSTVTEALKSGIVDFILKPFQPEELEAKVNKALQLGRGGADHAGDEGEGDGAQREQIDLLLIDSKENVAKRLRALIPEKLSMESVTTSNEGLSRCREKNFKVIFCDLSMPAVKPSVFAGQIKTLQPDSMVAAMVLRTDPLTLDAAKSQGFDAVIHKPFDVDQLEDMVLKRFKIQDVLTVADNILTVKPFTGKEDRIKKYYASLKELMYEQFPEIAAACYEQVLLDFSQSELAEAHAEQLAPILSDARDASRKMGLEFRVIASEEFRKGLSANTKTASLPAFESLDAAQQAG